ncbi:Endoribonuclease L-PSP/chorismate mutase-like protein [Massariosphaeria phaeospora]|uniref:Endoribonuclease L-PSP/chorismate mutase-like protein n=1 Tax=Massariosphaeria phaeospora TaxID=100035 RepID=A0A7C8I080_9PLEO|nr:Endoribonuclease L-PSP/chorismate mutase-like protein [Massariosphaeria phaeospora]
MAHLEYFVYEGFGVRTAKEVHSSQAVRVAGRIEISGQGGWNRLTEAIPSSIADEVDQAFANVEHALQQAGGAGFSQVYKLRIYTTERDDGVGFMDILGEVVRNLKTYCPGHRPIMTGVQVARLYGDMRVEIEAVADLG